MSPDHSLILKYFPDLTAKQIRQFELMGDIYQDWNSKINVISRKDMDSFYVHHVLHALGIARVIQFPPGAKLLDIGTGGGFPGIPLAILFPEVHFHLVDSIGKKITVVKDVVRQLELKNVEAQQTRAKKNLNRILFHFVISRAVPRLEEFPALGSGEIPERRNLHKDFSIMAFSPKRRRSGWRNWRPFKASPMYPYFSG